MVSRLKSFALVILIGIAGCRSSYINVYKTETSPDGRYVATLFTSGRAGALGQSFGSVNLRQENEEFRPETVNDVLVLDNPADLSAKWAGANLVITRREGNVLRSVPRWRDVNITMVDPSSSGR